MSYPSGIVFDVRRHVLHDGPGIRTAFFLKGCPLSCLWCHNPEGLLFYRELQRRPERCIACGACAGLAELGGQEGDPPPPGALALADACPAGALESIGRAMTPGEVVDIALKDEVYYRGSGGGVTFTGGEPLAQGDFLVACLAACGHAGLHRAVDTSGYADPGLVKLAASRAELFLFDIKCADEGLHRVLTGVSNRLILSNLELLVSLGATVQPSIPLIPGMNDAEEELAEIARRLAELGLGREWPVRLLPYHSAARGKYARRSLAYSCETIPIPTALNMESAARPFIELGLSVVIGGLS